MSDLISVIIPAFNAEEFLEDCLRSLTAQTFQNLEIILINDGSTDHTGEIAEKWATKDIRISVIHQENKGVSAARNKGLKIAKGNYIGFVDADDEVERDMYEFLHNNLKKYDADISHCGFELVKKDKTVQFHNTEIILVQNKFEAMKELLSGKIIEPGIWNKLYKKSVLENVFFDDDLKINEDLLFNIKSFSNTDQSVFEDVIKYKYKYNSQSASHSSKILFIQEEVYKAAQRIRLLLHDDELKDTVEIFYIAKILTILKSLKKHHLFKTELSNKLRDELKDNSFKNLGLRLLVLKILLVNFPFIYEPFIYFYDLIFAKNQKWKKK